MAKDYIFQSAPAVESVDPKGPRPLQRQIFVAYAYSLYDRRDYRRIFTALVKTYGVKFIFADEKITNMHILQKIISYIRTSDFSLFDISGWNPNVTLELGVALALSDNWYICFDPKHTPVSEVPSDIKGLDRIQYGSYAELEEKLSALLEQQYPKQVRQPLEDYLASMRDEVTKLVAEQPGLKMNQIAKLIGVEVKTAQVVVTPLVGTNIRVEGQRRGARYFPIEISPSKKQLIFYGSIQIFRLPPRFAARGIRHYSAAGWSNSTFGYLSLRRLRP